MSEPLLIAKGSQPLYLLPRMANRHGLIAGATGTGLGRQIIRGVLGSTLGGRRR